MRETRIWRVANSAQWVAWGIVQAKVPGMGSALNDGKRNGSPTSDETVAPQTDHNVNRHGPDLLAMETTPLAHDAHDKRPEGLRAESLVEGKEPHNEDEGDEEFDYLGYAQERAMFFWGDVLRLGIAKKEELPQELLEKIKIIGY